MGELNFGVGRDYRNLVYVSVDMGVGAGIIINNKLFEGARLAAGEIGYFASTIADMDFDHPHYGPLESRVALPGIINKVKKDLNAGAVSQILQLVQGDINKIDIKTIETAIKLKDAYILKEMEQVRDELGVALANIITLFDLEVIILGGKLTDIGYNFLDFLNEIIAKLTPLNTRLIYSSLNRNAVIYGAFAAALEYVNNNILRIK